MLPLVLLSLGALISWGAWGFVLWRFDPETSRIALLLFYASLGAAFWGTLTTTGMVWRWRMRDRIASRAEIGILARQALLITMFIIAILNLAAQHLLKWWNIIPLVLLTAALEVFFNSLNKRDRHSYASKSITK